MHKDMDRDNGGRLYFPVHGVLESGMYIAELARLTGIVKGMEMRITKETDGRGRKE